MCETKYLKKLTFRKIFRKIVFDENDLNYFVIARSLIRNYLLILDISFYAIISVSCDYPVTTFLVRAIFGISHLRDF